MKAISLTRMLTSLVVVNFRPGVSFIVHPRLDFPKSRLLFQNEKMYKTSTIERLFSAEGVGCGNFTHQTEDRARRDEMTVPRQTSSIPDLRTLMDGTIVRKLKGFIQSAASDKYRISHSFVGVSSLAVGFHHFYDIAVVHSFTQHLSPGMVGVTGILHTSCGMLGMRRLRFGNEKEAARNAMFWPVPLQNLWLTGAALSEWG